MHLKKSNVHKQSLKQLGISYGVLSKQDNTHKLVSSKKRREALSKEFSPGKRANLKPTSTFFESGIYLNGNRIVSYDEQTGPSPQ